MLVKRFESFSDEKVGHIKDLKNGDLIMYHGSKCEVIEEDEFAVKVKSTQTGRSFTINQGQLEQYGVTQTVQ